MSYIQLPYGFCKNSKQIQFNLLKNYETSQYVKRVPYITNKCPDFENKVIDLINNREDLKQWLLATMEMNMEMKYKKILMQLLVMTKNLIMLLLGTP